MKALDKFAEAMNKTSDFWAKDIRVTAKNGEIIIVECDGFTFMSDHEFAETSCNSKDL